MGIERSIAQEIGGTLGGAFCPLSIRRGNLRFWSGTRTAFPAEADRPGFPDESCAKIETWIHNAVHRNQISRHRKKAVTCSHPNNDPIMRLAADLGCACLYPYVLKVGGSRACPAADNLPSESTQWTWRSSRALSAGRDSLPVILRDWELGVRAIRPHKKVLMEFAGSDPHSGMVDYAMRELGADGSCGAGTAPAAVMLRNWARFWDADISKAVE